MMCEGMVPPMSAAADVLGVSCDRRGSSKAKGFLPPRYSRFHGEKEVLLRQDEFI